MIMLDNSQQQQQLGLEITVVSAQGLKNTASSVFSSRRLRPFVTVTTFPPRPPCNATNHKRRRHVFQTRVDDHGGVNPFWGDKFHVLLDDAFFANRYSCIYLQLFTKRLIAGRAHLGWCHIPAADIGLPPVGSVRQLSYRLRAGDGTRTQGVVNVAIKLEGQVPSASHHDQLSNDACQTVIGIPVSMMPRVMEIGAHCEEGENLTSGNVGPEVIEPIEWCEGSGIQGDYN